jgi:hypothetical protein
MVGILRLGSKLYVVMFNAIKVVRQVVQLM